MGAVRRSPRAVSTERSRRKPDVLPCQEIPRGIEAGNFESGSKVLPGAFRQRQAVGRVHGSDVEEKDVRKRKRGN